MKLVMSFESVNIFMFSVYVGIIYGGSGWPTSLRRWYIVLALPLSGFESRQQERKKGIGKTLQRMCPNSPKNIQNDTGRSRCMLRSERKEKKNKKNIVMKKSDIFM